MTYLLTNNLLFLHEYRFGSYLHYVTEIISLYFTATYLFQSSSFKFDLFFSD